ncbi:hypothetical protein [Peribacillus simplex]
MLGQAFEQSGANEMLCKSNEFKRLQQVVNRLDVLGLSTLNQTTF